jgi:hypothetical protein
LFDLVIVRPVPDEVLILLSNLDITSIPKAFKGPMDQLAIEAGRFFNPLA